MFSPPKGKPKKDLGHTQNSQVPQICCPVAMSMTTGKVELYRQRAENVESAPNTASPVCPIEMAALHPDFNYVNT